MPKVNQEPTVCCVLLTRARTAMAARAIECFRRQTYAPKRLLVYDTSAELPAEPIQERGVLNFYRGPVKSTIGALRNEANEFALMGAQPAPIDIITHMDDDDWSHPNRLAEQVALLQSSGAECVGYTQALFWETRPELDIAMSLAHPRDCECVACQSYEGGGWPKTGARPVNKAWLYTSPHAKTALGGTLCYWRSTWERKHFQDLRHGEDTAWQCGLRVECVSSVSLPVTTPYDPRFIAQIHGSNTSSHINPRASEWRRVPEWDQYCVEMMKL